MFDRSWIQSNPLRSMQLFIRTLRQSPLLQRYGQRIVALVSWVLLLIGYQWYAIVHEFTPLGMARELFMMMNRPLVGPLLFMLFYTFQPLIFFPSWLLTVGAGYLYGPLWGSIYTVIAANLSSVVAYFTGWFFGAGILDSSKAQSVLHRYTQRMRERSFETVLFMRFLFLPYDLVSYLAGFLRIRWKPFLVATIIGSLPGSLSFVFFGASIEGDFEGQKLGLDPWVLGASASLFLMSVVLWRSVRRFLPSNVPTDGSSAE